MPFLVKNCCTLSTMWTGALVNNPSWNGQMHWKSLQKKFTEAEHSLSPQCQLVHWYRWFPRTLTQQGKPVLQGAHPPEDNFSFFGSPSYLWTQLLILLLFLDNCNPLRFSVNIPFMEEITNSVLSSETFYRLHLLEIPFGKIKKRWHRDFDNVCQVLRRVSQETIE